MVFSFSFFHCQSDGNFFFNQILPMTYQEFFLKSKLKHVYCSLISFEFNRLTYSKQTRIILKNFCHEIKIRFVIISYYLEIRRKLICLQFKLEHFSIEKDYVKWTIRISMTYLLFPVKLWMYSRFSQWNRKINRSWRFLLLSFQFHSVLDSFMRSSRWEMNFIQLTYDVCQHLAVPRNFPAVEHRYSM